MAGLQLGGRVERRVLLLFALLTILPMVLFGYFTVRELAAQAEEQAEQQLRRASKAYALTLLERLQALTGTSHLDQTRARSERGVNMESRPHIRIDGDALVLEDDTTGDQTRIELEDWWWDLAESGDGISLKVTTGSGDVS